MTDIIDAVVGALAPTDPELLRAAAQAGTSMEEHHHFSAQVAALQQVEYRPAPPGAPFRLPQRIAAWNLERVLHPAPSAEVLRASGAEVVLLSEVDAGMARTGNRHNAAELADRLGMGYAYGVEFVELGLGDGTEIAAHVGTANARSLHGNTLLSRFPLHDIRLIRLDEGGYWFGGRRGQKRLGWRMALAARVGEGDDALVVVSVHLESDSTPEDRAVQMRRLAMAIDGIAGAAPVIVGGDLNTNALPQNARAGDAWFAHPETAEPLFAAMRDAGYDFAAANSAASTQRVGTTGKPVGDRRLDWFFTRGLDVSAPATLPALGGDGTVLSDHELILVTAARK